MWRSFKTVATTDSTLVRWYHKHLTYPSRTFVTGFLSYPLRILVRALSSPSPVPDLIRLLFGKHDATEFGDVSDDFISQNNILLDVHAFPALFLDLCHEPFEEVREERRNGLIKSL